MSRRGCPCFIPKLPVSPKADFTPYIFTESQMADIFAACDAYRLYDVRMGTSLMAMPAVCMTSGIRLQSIVWFRWIITG